MPKIIYYGNSRINIKNVTKQLKSKKIKAETMYRFAKLGAYGFSEMLKGNGKMKWLSEYTKMYSEISEQSLNNPVVNEQDRNK